MRIVRPSRAGGMKAWSARRRRRDRQFTSALARTSLNPKRLDDLRFHLAEAEEASEDILGALRALRYGKARTRRQFDELIRHLYSELCLHLPYHVKGADRLLLSAMPEISDAEFMKRVKRPRPRRTR